VRLVLTKSSAAKELLDRPDGRVSVSLVDGTNAAAEEDRMNISKRGQVKFLGATLTIALLGIACDARHRAAPPAANVASAALVATIQPAAPKEPTVAPQSGANDACLPLAWISGSEVDNYACNGTVFACPEGAPLLTTCFETPWIGNVSIANFKPTCCPSR
jgi:hypothetical protein